MKKSIIISLFLGLSAAYNCQAETNTAPIAAEAAIGTGQLSTLATAPIVTAATVKYCLTLTGSRDTCYFDANLIAKHPAPNGAEPCRPNTCF